MGHLKTATLAMASMLAFAPLAAHAGSYDANTQLCYGGGSTVGMALNAVESAIAGAKFTNLRDQTNLLSKVSAANSKTLVQKWADASGKLSDISDTATALAGAAKPKLDSADAINSAVLAAQACITYP